MTQNEVLNCEALKELMTFLTTKVSCINYGGCAIAAIAIHDCLKKHGFKSEIVYAYSYRGESYEINKKGRKDFSDFAACSHAMVKVNGFYIDATGVRDIKDWEIKHIVKRSFVVLSVKKGDWNSAFERDTEYPKIKKKIGYDLLAVN